MNKNQALKLTWTTTAVLFVLMGICHSGVSSAHAAKQLPKSSAYNLIFRKFTEKFSPDSIQFLEISNVSSLGASKMLISYKVGIQDNGDLKHPALNKMQATALFANQDGKWNLQEIRGLSQSIEFQLPH